MTLPNSDIAFAQPTPGTQERPVGFGLRWLILIVFVSSTCMMVLELVAGRIVAPYVGVSLYTWTSVIGVVLAGMSLGNYLGGKLADRWASPRLLGIIFLLGSLFSVGILLSEELGVRLPAAWSIVLRILALTAALFFLPSVLLGTVSPVVAKLAVRDLTKTGSTVGRISAAGTLGSIVGTFATGLVLISLFGTRLIVWGVSIVLFTMAVILLLSSANRIRAPLAIAAIAFVVGADPGCYAGVVEVKLHSGDQLLLHQSPRGHPRWKPVRILVLDRLVHSYSSLDDPTRLVYGYEQVYAEATAYQAARRDPLRALFIGGGVILSRAIWRIFTRTARWT